MAADIATWAEEWERHTAPDRGSDATPLRPQRVLADLRAACPTTASCSATWASHHNWIVQEWRPGGPGTLLQSWGFASMCFGIGRRARRPAGRARTRPRWPWSATAAS